MKTELTLLERREIAKQTVPLGTLNPHTGWIKILANTHKKETYDEFNIPEYKEDIDEYLRTHPILIHPKKRIPWNKGKKKPTADDCGILWCNCDNPKLTSNAGGRGQALCLLCGTPWYH